jgi:carotenoid cleavage dioxygenase-like enzyme
LKSETISEQFLEFPRINDNYDGRSYQFTYATDPRTHVSSGEKRPLYKIKLQDRSIVTWFEPGCFCGEPIFVAAPKATQEDEGVILSVVTNPQNKSSFLVILDATNFQEIARAEIPQLIPEGFHGQFFNTVY